MSDLWPTLHRSPILEEDAQPPPEFTEPTGDLPSCPACEDDSAVETVGAEVICRRCGTIVDIPLEWAAEYRWFSADAAGGGPDPSRCGFPVNPLLPKSSIGTIILYKNNSRAMRCVKKYHSWSMMPYREHALWSVFEGLQIRASNAGIGSAVVEEAKELYAQLTASAICRGQAQRESMLAACLWEALKRHGAPRLQKDIAEIFLIPIRNVTKGIRQFQHLLAARTSGERTDTYAVPDATTVTKETATATATAESEDVIARRAQHRKTIWQQTVAKPTSYEDFIQPFLTNLAIPRHYSATMDQMVRQVCERADELDVVPENTPPSLTASVIMFCASVLDIRLDPMEVSRVCGVSTVTIQKCLKRLTPRRDELLGEFISGE